MRERADLQRLLRDDIIALDEDLLVVAEEYFAAGAPGNRQHPSGITSYVRAATALPTDDTCRNLPTRQGARWPRRLRGRPAQIRSALAARAPRVPQNIGAMVSSPRPPTPAW
jgi:hypothetical protein